MRKILFTLGKRVDFFDSYIDFYFSHNSLTISAQIPELYHRLRKLELSSLKISAEDGNFASKFYLACEINTSEIIEWHKHRNASDIETEKAVLPCKDQSEEENNCRALELLIEANEAKYDAAMFSVCLINANERSANWLNNLQLLSREGFFPAQVFLVHAFRNGLVPANALKAMTELNAFKSIVLSTRKDYPVFQWLPENFHNWLRVDELWRDLGFHFSDKTADLISISLEYAKARKLSYDVEKATFRFIVSNFKNSLFYQKELFHAMGYFLQEGRCVPQNVDLSYAWYNQAAAAGHENAVAARDSIIDRIDHKLASRYQEKIELWQKLQRKDHIIGWINGIRGLEVEIGLREK